MSSRDSASGDEDTNDNDALLHRLHTSEIESDIEVESFTADQNSENEINVYEEDDDNRSRETPNSIASTDDDKGEFDSRDNTRNTDDEAEEYRNKEKDNNDEFEIENVTYSRSEVEDLEVDIEKDSPKSLTARRVQLSKPSTPKYPDFFAYESRLNTYGKMAVRAPEKMHHLAKAGFFGKGHNIVCFFCGGEIKKRNAGEDVWFDHDLLLGECEFHDSFRTAELNMPGVQLAIEMGFRFSLIQKVLRTELEIRGSSFTTPDLFINACIECQSSVRQRVMENSQLVLDYPFVRSVLNMGFTEDLIQSVITYKIEGTGSPFTNSESLIDACVDFQRYQGGEWSGFSQAAQLVEKPSKEVVASKTSTSKVAARDDADSERDEFLSCKICMDEIIGVVFVPCGHQMACSKCAIGLKHCPVCREGISSTVRTFFP